MDIRNLPQSLWIGRVGENKARSFSFDFSYLSPDQDTNASLIWERPDGSLYPAVIEGQSSPLIWTPNAADLAFAGNGKIEIRISKQDMLVKSATIIGKVTSSLQGEEALPAAPNPDWIQNITQTAAQVENDKAQIEEILSFLQLQTSKDAYAAAQEGGYIGTKADFYADLAAIEGLSSWFSNL